jgi:hypothetical protein
VGLPDGPNGPLSWLDPAMNSPAQSGLPGTGVGVWSGLPTASGVTAPSAPAVAMTQKSDRLVRICPPLFGGRRANIGSPNLHRTHADSQERFLEDKSRLDDRERLEPSPRVEDTYTRWLKRPDDAIREAFDVYDDGMTIVWAVSRQ